MRSLLKILVIFFCVHKGEGHWLKTPIDLKQEATSTQKFQDGVKRIRYSAVDDSQTEASGIGSSLVPTVKKQFRKRRSNPSSDCRLQSILLKVQDLDLGYDSDEDVLFKYCSGSCPRALSTHELTLNKLLRSGLLPSPPSGEVCNKTPCCRPTDHEDMAFLDNSYRWHKIEKISATGCRCVS